MQSVKATVELTFEDLRQELEQVRGTMPPRTLYRVANPPEAIATPKPPILPTLPALKPKQL